MTPVLVICVSAAASRRLAVFAVAAASAGMDARVAFALEAAVAPAREGCSSWSLARPKSRILAWPQSVTKMLAGLMSR